MSNHSTSETQHQLEQQRRLAEQKAWERQERAQQRQMEEERERAEEEELEREVTEVEQAAEEEQLQNKAAAVRWLQEEDEQRQRAEAERRAKEQSLDEEDEEEVVARAQHKGKKRAVMPSSSESSSGSESESNEGTDREKENGEEKGKRRKKKEKTKTKRESQSWRKSEEEKKEIQDWWITRAEQDWPVAAELCSHCLSAGYWQGNKAGPTQGLMPSLHLDKNNEGKRKQEEGKGDFEPEERAKKPRVEEGGEALPHWAAAVGVDRVWRRQRREQAEALDDPMIHLAWSIESMQRQQVTMNQAILEQLEMANCLLEWFVKAYEKANGVEEPEGRAGEGSGGRAEGGSMAQ
ncbi:unnamed protein product [Cyclocybe aegerita]|uniref:Uncharacterized protein n=1 Tax=Cyclocybe aegerita TaxID=1973307 RepID=A0A8S0WM90_CYCAE|nr:unnamed protein product [Cyclocybe aegerita]